MDDINKVQNLKEKAYNICSDLLHGAWKTISIDEFKLEPVSGGLSNGLGLFRCSLPDSPSNGVNHYDRNIPKEVLLRFYNKEHESKEALVQESVIFAILSEKQIGPKLYGVFPGGRLEEFIPSRSADWNDFSALHLSVAKELVKIHCLEMPIKKTPIFEEQIHQSLEDIDKCLKVNPTLEVPEFFVNGDFQREFSWLKEEIRKLNPDVVFCHNDLQGGNILILNDSEGNSDKKIVFVDFEFSAYNYRTFDIVDHFIEKCFYYKPTVPPHKIIAKFDNFPTQEEQEGFVNAYVNQLQKSNTDLKDNFNLEEEKQKILKEIPIMRLAPLLFWSSIVTKHSLNPYVDFAFSDAAHLTWNLYNKLKGEINRGTNVGTKTNCGDLFK